MVLLIAATLLSQQQPKTTDAAVQAYMTAHKVVGASVCVIVDGRTVHNRGYGFQDREKSVPATDKTVYRLGSVSKPVTAVAAMRLVQDKKLDLGADLRTYAPSFPAKPFTLTAQDILTHSSGIRHYTAAKRDTFLPHFATVEDSLSVFATDPLLFEPRTRFSYSTHAFTLLARAIESASGKTFGQALQEYVFKHSGTKTLGLEDLTKPPVKNRAELYDQPIPNGPMVHSVKREDNSWKYAGGGMESTAPDLAKFGHAVMTGKTLKPATVALMWKPVPLKDGTKRYGLGWIVSPSGTAEHGGAQQGCRAYLRVDPRSKTVMAVLTNTSGHPVGALADDVWNVWVKD